jgi:hypothetical protein
VGRLSRRGVNCSNHGGYYVTIYVRRGATWREALSANEFASVFLSIDWQNGKSTEARSVWTLIINAQRCLQHIPQFCTRELCLRTFSKPNNVAAHFRPPASQPNRIGRCYGVRREWSPSNASHHQPASSTNPATSDVSPVV